MIEPSIEKFLKENKDLVDLGDLRRIDTKISASPYLILRSKYKILIMVAAIAQIPCILLQDQYTGERGYFYDLRIEDFSMSISNPLPCTFGTHSSEIIKEFKFQCQKTYGITPEITNKILITRVVKPGKSYLASDVVDII